MMARKGFTLIELLVSISIFAVIMSSLYFAFSTGTFGWRNIEQNTASFQSALNLFGRINSDLRNSFPYNSDDSKFTGEEGKVSFLTLVNSNVAGGVEKDYANVSYWLEGVNIVRSLKLNKDALNDAKVAPTAIISNNIKGISFSYLKQKEGTDIMEEKNVWQSTDGFPDAVKITLTMLGAQAKTYIRTVYFPIVKK